MYVLFLPSVPICFSERVERQRFGNRQSMVLYTLFVCTGSKSWSTVNYTISFTSNICVHNMRSELALRQIIVMRNPCWKMAHIECYKHLLMQNPIGFPCAYINYTYEGWSKRKYTQIPSRRIPTLTFDYNYIGTGSYASINFIW